MSETRLEPCPNPWCDAINVRTKRSRGLPGMMVYWVRCSCGVSSPPKQTREEADVAWNTRHDPQRQRLVDALKAMLEYCPLSGDMALMIRGIQGGGDEAQHRANVLIEHYSYLDAVQDEARAVLKEVAE